MSDPLFAEDLEQKIRHNQSPLPPLPKQLIRKTVPSFVKDGFRRSVFSHGALLVLVLVSGFVGSFIETDSEKQARLQAILTKSAIRVDMVDLPSLKPQDMMNIDATQKVGKIEAPSKKEKEIEKELPKVKPSDTAMLDRTRDAKDSLKKEKKVDRLKALRDSLRADNRRRELSQKLKGETSPGGRPVLAGNILSEGDSVSGDMATLIDAYNGKVKAHLRQNWNVPGWMTTGKLKARVLVKVAPDGRILSQQFLQKSGNAEFDGYVSKALEMANPFPPPPEHLKRIYMEDGLEWGFPQ